LPRNTKQAPTNTLSGTQLLRSAAAAAKAASLLHAMVCSDQACFSHALLQKDATLQLGQGLLATADSLAPGMLVQEAFQQPTGRGASLAKMT
jgi:hypothetical protein